MLTLDTARKLVQASHLNSKVVKNRLKPLYEESYLNTKYPLIELFDVEDLTILCPYHLVTLKTFQRGWSDIHIVFIFWVATVLQTGGIHNKLNLLVDSQPVMWRCGVRGQVTYSLPRLASHFYMHNHLLKHCHCKLPAPLPLASLSFLVVVEWTEDTY